MVGATLPEDWQRRHGEFLDKLKDIGFRFATRPASRWAIDDMMIPTRSRR